MAIFRQTQYKIPRNGGMLVIAGVCLGLHFVTWFESLNHISIAISTLLVCTSPVWAGIAEALFFKKKPSRSFWIGLALAFVGLSIVSLSSAQTARGSVALGCMWALLGALFIVAYMFLTQRSQVELGTWRTVGWTYSSAAISLWVVALFLTPKAIVPQVPAAWGSVIGMALFAQLIGHTSMNWALKHFSAGIVGVAMLLEPVFAAGLAWPIFGEPISLVQGIGAVVLLGGVGVVLGRQASESGS
jgi:drug/metabolite transporter (DMT)-like permease